METDTLKNFIEWIKFLSTKKYFGDIIIKMEDGNISIANKTDKIKFDNKNYFKYKKENNQ